MKRILPLLTACCMFFLNAWSQSAEEGVELDLLKAPASPASNLLGIAVSDIDKPTDVSAFMLSLQKASGNFTMLPSSYAVDIAPYWLLKKKMGDVTTEGLKRSSGTNVFKQTFVLSFAMRSTDSAETDLTPNSIYGGLGFKFSIFRGDYDETTLQGLAEIRKWQIVQVRIQSRTLENYKNDPDVLALQEERRQLLKEEARDSTSLERKKQIDHIIDSIGTVLADKLLDLKNSASTEAKQKIKEAAAAFQTARVGFTWDVSGGVSAEFRVRRFDDSKVYNAGIWTTLGYTGAKAGSALLLLRYLHNPDKIFAKDNAPNDIGDISTFDVGGRYIYSRPQAKFNASLEGVYRSVLTSNTIDPSWRIIFNADYAVSQNQKLTFSFGRNFDGSITKGGNLVAALSFLTGFGNKR